jgi:hypothetical protein
MMKKINLKEFQASKLTLSERLNVKGGSGNTKSTRRETRSTCQDCDGNRKDADC